MQREQLAKGIGTLMVTTGLLLGVLSAIRGDGPRILLWLLYTLSGAGLIYRASALF
jgi:hypothetical protein